MAAPQSVKIVLALIYLLKGFLVHEQIKLCKHTKILLKEGELLLIPLNRRLYQPKIECENFYLLRLKASSLFLWFFTFEVKNFSLLFLPEDF